MAVVSVSAENLRLEDFNDDPPSTGSAGQFGAGGGNAESEPDIVYEGVAAWSRPIGTSLRGLSLDMGANTTDMTTPTSSVWLLKCTVTNPNALESRTTPALTARLGNGSTSNFREWYVAGNDDGYPAAGGFILRPIDLTLSEYWDATNGSVTETAVDFFCITGLFSATSRAANVVLDAVDVGCGLTLVGGDGGDTDGTFQDFIDFDESITTNRFGYVSSREGVLYVNGKLRIGQGLEPTNTATATEFTDAGSTVVWNNGYFGSNWAEIRFNLVNSNTTINLTSTTLVSRGERNNTLGLGYVTTQDTRANLIITGSAGYVSSSGCAYQNFNTASLNDAVRLTGGTLEAAYMIQSGSHVDAVKITTTSTSSVATLQDFTGTQTGTSGLYNCTFVQGNDGHAMVISGSSFDFYGLKFQGYGNTTSDSASVYVSASTGTVTINLFNDGDTPTYKSDGATVNIVQSVQLRVSNAVSGSEVQLVSSSGADLDTVAGTNFQIDETTGRLPTEASSNNFATYNYNYPGYDQEIYVIVHSLGYEYQLIEATLGSVGQTIRTSQVEDRNYDEGQTPFDPI